MGKWMERGRARWAGAATLRPDTDVRGDDSTVPIAASNDQTTKATAGAAVTIDPLRAWRFRNAEMLTGHDGRLGRDPGGWCAEHNRWLSYPEQRRGACSWCVPVDRGREPEYWASH